MKKRMHKSYEEAKLMREIIKVSGRKNFPVIRSKQPKVFLLLNITLHIEIQISDLELTSEV
jgi:hypothetical protein